jgi:hypothetical protein
MSGGKLKKQQKTIVNIAHGKRTEQIISSSLNESVYIFQ